jgi:hypothetical protein
MHSTETSSTVDSRFVDPCQIPKFKFRKNRRLKNDMYVRTSICTYAKRREERVVIFEVVVLYPCMMVLFCLRNTFHFSVAYSEHKLDSDDYVGISASQRFARSGICRAVELTDTNC